MCRKNPYFVLIHLAPSGNETAKGGALPPPHALVADAVHAGADCLVPFRPKICIFVRREVAQFLGAKGKESE